MNEADAITLLMDSSLAMHSGGIPLMRRMLPEDEILMWEHYPDEDVVNGKLFCRYFYHCHPPEEREWGEHGHFHLFVGKAAMPKGTRPAIKAPKGKKRRPKVVHIAALSVDANGMPIRWFTINRWVTDEYLYGTSDITPLLKKFDLRGEHGDPLVNDWLTAMVQLSRRDIAELLEERDAMLLQHDPSGEDRDFEILSSKAIDLAALVDG